MLFTRSTKYSFPPELSLGNSDTLEVKKEHRILGIFIQDNLRWSSQVQQMVGKATKNNWGPKKNASPGCGREDTSGLLEGRMPGPLRGGLASLASWPDGGPV